MRDAKKNTIDGAHVLEVLEGVHEMFVVKGKKVTHLDLRRQRPDDDTLRALLLGPTGNLRAPSLKAGTVLAVGFEPETYKRLLAL